MTMITDPLALDTIVLASQRPNQVSPRKKLGQWMEKVAARAVIEIQEVDRTLVEDLAQGVDKVAEVMASIQDLGISRPLKVQRRWALRELLDLGLLEVEILNHSLEMIIALI
eukprot:CAMPEP_0114577798 /NCGR_PEP_ID=MMETSP0125-20121206/2418_1 /TAXON_ID=485358 ORGANISM="Aristerostoma sp., Strain ATCC 50986" /NCGR_SAMPLE_ID=MMETSP0125 /ASSEMBLY_ACC=CAM_ASM_000245 /LENGTH=111 /DNA_ID=CAMNT_0001767389 /DNA_START=296 /DNA_END=631 /DNA_ORIENTATION=+